MHEIDSATEDELRTLRARAYGPSADIHHDPSAEARLRELEARTSSTADPPAPLPETIEAVPLDPPAQTAPPSDPAPPAAVEPDPSPSEQPARDAASSRGIPRSLKILWALSVAVAAAAAAAITFGLTFIAPVADYGDATQIATLEPSTTQIPSGYMGAGPSSRAFEFYGYTLFETAGGLSYFNAQGSDCFVLVPTEQIPAEYDAQVGYSIDFSVYSGCAAGDFPAVAQLTTGAGSPEELRARFPDDSALRFVFDGSRVGVFLAHD